MPSLEEVEAIKRLANLLEANPRIARLGSGAEPGGWLVANALAHVEESCSAIVARIASLSGKASVSAQDELLIELGEDLRHVMYHVRETQLFNYVVDR
jgi:hypothetical protein